MRLRDVLLACLVLTFTMCVAIGALGGALAAVFEFGVVGLLAYIPAMFVCFLAMAGAQFAMEKIR